MREHLHRLPVHPAEQLLVEDLRRRPARRDPAAVHDRDPVGMGRGASTPRWRAGTAGGSSTSGGGGTVGGAGTVGGSGTAGGSAALAATGSGTPTGLLLGASGLLAAAGAAVVVAVRRRAMES